MTVQLAVIWGGSIMKRTKAFVLLRLGDDIMPMNLVIQEKRKELGLTQEQVAKCLNVSVPAVSKWESGQTSPDISLLSPLARLLKIDLNTLCCFQENMSFQEIEHFCGEIKTIVQTKGIAEGFEAAEQKIREYPHHDALLHYLTIILDGLLTMAGVSPDERRPYDDMLASWYNRLSESTDSKIRNSANYMIVGKLIRKGEYDKAQEVLDIMPDREDLISSMADKRMLQILLYQQQGKTKEAAKDLQSALLMELNKVTMLLYKMIDVELASGQMQTAQSIADKAGRMAELFDLHKYFFLLPSLQIAGAEKNADACIEILREMLAAICTPQDMGSSPLFHCIAKTFDAKQMLPAILSELERDSAYDFLQNRSEFKQLLSKYKALTEVLPA